MRDERAVVDGAVILSGIIYPENKILSRSYNHAIGIWLFPASSNVYTVFIMQ